jgi:hypothetical protein
MRLRFDLPCRDRYRRVGTKLFVPGNLAAVVAKVVRELLPVFGHSAANPTNSSALPAQVRPDLTLLALGVVRHEAEVSGAVRQLSTL